MTDRPILPALTGLRFFLAFLVLLFHQTDAEGLLGPAVLNPHSLLGNVLRSGYVSVGFFYLLSGFVLAYGYDLSSAWDKSRQHRFLLARFARIYPVYLLALLISLPLFISLLHRTIPTFPLATSIIALISTPVLIQSWFPDSATLWNGPSWSLSDEMLFYLLFPFLGRIFWRMDRLKGIFLLATGLWLASLATTWGLGILTSPALINGGATGTPVASFWTSLIKYNPLLHLAEFCVGILTAKFYLMLREKQAQHWFLREGAWLYCVALIAEIVVLAHAEYIPYALLHNGLLVPVHATLLVGLANGGRGLPRWLGARPVVFLGQASYALYLLHISTYSWMHAVLKHVGHMTMSGLWFLALYSVLCVALSCVVFAYVEEPVRGLVLRRFGTRRPTVVSVHVSHL